MPEATPIARLLLLLRRRWRWLLFLIVVAISVAVMPHLRAWYHLRAGRSALEHYRAEESRSHFNACLQVWPRRGSVHLLAARAARRACLYEEAAQHLEEAQRLLGASEDVLLEWALLRAVSGHLDHEVEKFLWSRLRNSAAQGPLICEALAEGCLRTYRLRAAQLCLQAWLEDQPDNVQALWLRAAYWHAVHEFHKAAADYRRVVELDPERREAHGQLARCLLDLGQYPEALPHLEEACRRQPDDPNVRVFLARCLAELGHKDQAQQILDGVLSEHPKHGLALRQRGQQALREGQLAEAERWLQQALRVLPYDYEANSSLLECLQQQGESAKAQAQQERVEQLKKLLQRVREISAEQLPARPHDPALHCELGKLLLDLGRTDIGLNWLRSALEQNPRCRPAHAALAEYFQRQGDPDKAAYHRWLAQGDQP
jgi:tetratricopeptide (TPR) repeat protein